MAYLDYVPTTPDPTTQTRPASELLPDGASRSTSQQTITLGLVFLRQ